MSDDRRNNRKKDEEDIKLDFEYNDDLVELDADIVKDIQSYMDLEEEEPEKKQKEKVFSTKEITFFDDADSFSPRKSSPRSVTEILEALDFDDDEEDDTYEDDDEYEDDDQEVPVDDASVGTHWDDEDDYHMKTKRKLSKEQIVNRVMAGMGIAIAAFTVFYGVVVYGIMHPKEENQVKTESESPSQVLQETTTQYVDESIFVSPYSDQHISEDAKNLLNHAKLKSMKTKHSKLDKKVDKVMTQVVDSSKSNYENVRNIYDYLLSEIEYKNKSYVDEDSIYDFCSTGDYESFLDMKIIYRANQALTNRWGSADDLACAFMVLTRRLGLEAYYIDGAIYNEDGDYESHGYALIRINDVNYIFDPSYDVQLMKKDKTSEPEESTTAPEEETKETSDQEKKKEEDTRLAPAYYAFCKTFDQVKDVYTKDDVENSISKFSGFATLGVLSFDAAFSSGGGNAYGSVKYQTGYSEDGNSVTASGEITLDVGDQVHVSGSVTGSSENTWKLVAKYYDREMNYITESTVYNENTASKDNEITYTVSRAGNIRLVFMITDSYGRTCAVSKTINVRGQYDDDDDDETTKVRETETEKETETTEPEETTTEEETTEEETTEEETTEEETTTEAEEPDTEPVTEPPTEE